MYQNFFLLIGTVYINLPTDNVDKTSFDDFRNLVLKYIFILVFNYYAQVLGNLIALCTSLDLFNFFSVTVAYVVSLFTAINNTSQNLSTFQLYVTCTV